jgi:hypothetical protein
MRNRKLLLCCLGAQLLLASCAGSSPKVPLDAPRFEAAPDSLPFVHVQLTPKPSWLDRVLHRTPATVSYPGLPAKIKNSTVSVTVNHVAGHQTNTSTSTSTTTGKNSRTVVGDGASNTEAGKKAGPVTQAGPGAAVHVATAATAATRRPAKKARPWPATATASPKRAAGPGGFTWWSGCWCCWASIDFISFSNPFNYIIYDTARFFC